MNRTVAFQPHRQVFRQSKLAACYFFSHAYEKYVLPRHDVLTAVRQVSLLKWCCDAMGEWRLLKYLTCGSTKNVRYPRGTARRAVLLSVKCNFDRLSNHFGFCPCVCMSVHRSIVERLRPQFFYRFSPNFAYRSEMWLFRTLLFLGQSGSSLSILELCKVRFWQFCDCGGHIFPRIVTKTPNAI